MSRIWKAWAGWRGREDDAPTGVAPSTDWGDYWVRKGIDEALKKPDELRETLHNLRHSTYVVVGVAAGLLLGIIGTMQILYADNSPEEAFGNQSQSRQSSYLVSRRSDCQCCLKPQWKG